MTQKTTRVNPLMATAAAAQVTAAAHALDSVDKCPICLTTMQDATSCGHPVRVCLVHRVCLPKENSNV